mgnify:CR=1 FL=1|tara:strand:+ start:8693 stop:9076 length:384 start_codon:yes stop_codon:yes gene_type:complete
MSDSEQLKGEADIAFRAGKLAEAREFYQAALSLRPDWVAVHNNLAMVLRQLGNRGGAERHFCRALAVDSDQIGTLSTLGALLVEQEHLQEAGEILSGARSLAPDNPGILYNCALLSFAGRQHVFNCN